MTEELIREIYLKTFKQESKGISVEELLAYRKELFTKADALISKKGHDYNREQQESGDTLFNLRVCEILGIVPITERGILVRLSDKFMRLISLVQVGVAPKNQDEKIEDTVLDIINYASYLSLIWKKRNERQ